MASLLYSTLIIFKLKVIFLFGPCFSMQTTPRTPSSRLDFKNQGKKIRQNKKAWFS
jgi:hypothetical protein